MTRKKLANDVTGKGRFKRMEKEFEEFISKRCEKALLEDNEYIELQKQLAEARKSGDMNTYGDLNIMIQTVVERVVYKAAVRDVYLMIS